jgi:hypothetical protein
MVITLVDLIPWLRYLPRYAPELKDEFERTGRLYTNQLNCVKLQMVYVVLLIFT